jgi:Raf kinase inhibitor-like YbhB/YbcL family protein
MSKTRLIWAALLLVTAIFACLSGCTAADDANMNLKLTSPAFKEGSSIPAAYSCDGQNNSPALSWSGAPAGTKSFALILHDPDAPREGGFTHWVIYNIPASSMSLEASVPKTAALSSGAVQGNNGAGNAGYTGPCPPAGPAHHYEFRFFALDQMLALQAGATKDQLEAAMSGHILAQTVLTGLFQRS